MRVTVLGCGGSGGVPLIGNRWGDCDPAEPRNRRTRCSILVEKGETSVLVDTSPDLRTQMLACGVQRVDAVLYTHAHADHANGIDDLRGVNWIMHRPLDVWADPATLEQIRTRFDYCFAPHTGGFFARPALVANEIEGPFAVGDVDVVPYEQDHGYSASLGFRFGRFAYSTDVVRMDDAAFALLDGVDTWIVDATRLTPHPVHAHLDLTLEWIARLRPRRAVLTHMNHTMDYRTLVGSLPDGVEPAYDGMVLEVPDA